MNNNENQEVGRSESDYKNGSNQPSTEPSVVRFTKHILGMGYAKEAWNSQKLFMIGSYILFVYVGLAIPENVLDDHPSAREFSDFMASIVPQIDRVTALGLSPQENRLNYSILWAASPVYFLLSLRWEGQHIEAGFYKHKPMSIRRLLAFVLFNVWIGGFSIFLWTGVETMPSNHPITIFLFKGDLVRSLWAPIMVMGFIIVTTATISAFKAILNRHLTVTW